MRNSFPKRLSGAPLHTLSKQDHVPVGFVHPPSSEDVYCFTCGRWRVIVARYWMICLVLLDSKLIWYILFITPVGNKLSLTFKNYSRMIRLPTYSINTIKVLAMRRLTKKISSFISQTYFSLIFDRKDTTLFLSCA